MDPDNEEVPQTDAPIHPRHAVRLIIPWSTSDSKDGLRTLGYLIDWEANRDNSSLQKDVLGIHCTHLAQLQRTDGNTHYLKQTISLNADGRVILCNTTVFNTDPLRVNGTPRYSMIGVYDLEKNATNRAVAARQKQNPQQLLCRVQENRADFPATNAPSSTFLHRAWVRRFPSPIIECARDYVKQGYEIDEDPVKGTRSYYPNPGVGDPSGILFRAASHPNEARDGIPFLRGNLAAQFGENRFRIQADNPQVSWSMPYEILNKLQGKWGPIVDNVPKTFGDAASTLISFYPKYVGLIKNELVFAPDKFEPFV